SNSVQETMARSMAAATDKFGSPSRRRRAIPTDLRQSPCGKVRRLRLRSRAHVAPKRARLSVTEFDARAVRSAPFGRPPHRNGRHTFVDPAVGDHPDGLDSPPQLTLARSWHSPCRRCWPAQRLPDFTQGVMH